MESVIQVLFRDRWTFTTVTPSSLLAALEQEQAPEKKKTKKRSGTQRIEKTELNGNDVGVHGNTLWFWVVL